MEQKIMADKQKPVHPKSKARDWSIQFLYQCETQKLFHFSESHFNWFVDYFKIEWNVIAAMKVFVPGVFKSLNQLNTTIEAHSKNWSLQRMPTTDRCVLRVAVYELLFTDSPRKVVINEAIELAKKYGTADSGSFVNAILDKVARDQEGQAAAATVAPVNSHSSIAANHP